MLAAAIGVAAAFGGGGGATMALWFIVAKSTPGSGRAAASGAGEGAIGKTKIEEITESFLLIGGCL